MALPFSEWVGMRVVLTWVKGESTVVMREVGMAGALFEGDDGAMFIPWTAVHCVKLATDG